MYLCDFITLVVYLSDDFSDGTGVRGVAQHIQYGVDAVARDLALFFRVKRIERFPQNWHTHTHSRRIRIFELKYV